ncbi:ABC transporter permease [Actinopolymorpha pittospori]|uniref:Peptide/nickel transport system permease protein n=1 Tax=Actinopolymorpha pittospori TaxID=648752 RepID=A0A927N8D0_9ACTN|nr:ABC transporter permease [Actinopolymorpha pittospori]MBE1612088.1 peptide/nickel transport system permease protein [Actinopolymorpha pittospori]
MAIIQEPMPGPEATPSEKGSDVGEIPQWRLMARRFKQSKLAVAGGIVLLLMYFVALFAPFLAPYDANAVNSDRTNAAPTKMTWHGGPAVCQLKQTLNQDTFTWEYATDCTNPAPVKWFVKGFEYKIFGLIPSTTHLFGVDKPNTVYLWGADDQGRDILSRTLAGSRVSLTIGLLGVGIGTALAAVIGTISGYFGGLVDNFLQRIIEIILSVPTLPLWATMAAVLPRDMTVTKRYLLITLILSLVAWAGLARQVRGKVMAYAGSDYVAAARAAGSGHARIILTHMVPNSVSHLVVVTMLAIPGTIIAETSLSFLGIGMLPPAVSWGVLLQDAQKVQVVTQYPWMLIPAAAVVLAVTCYQLLGDGVRDAVDPYG